MDEVDSEGWLKEYDADIGISLAKEAQYCQKTTYYSENSWGQY